MACSGSSTMNQTVCVTGAGGYIASWLVHHLLLRGYTVRGTARNPEDPKNSHLRSLEGAGERLTLLEADVLNYTTLYNAFQGCDGVFHTACPVTNDPDQVVTTVEGTKNVVDAAADAGIRRIVFTSSFGAVYMNPHRSPDAVVDESCWSDLDFCKKTNNWYCYGKVKAELTAMEEARRRGVELLTIVPHLTVGPMLQPQLNGSVYRVLTYTRGTKRAYPNAVMGVVDVRDVALAHVIVYESAATSGRYICVQRVIHRSEFVGILADLFPNYPVTTRCEDETNPMVKPFMFSDRRLKDLGFRYTTPIKKCLYDTVKSLQENGHLPQPEDLSSPSKQLSSL